MAEEQDTTSLREQILANAVFLYPGRARAFQIREHEKFGTYTSRPHAFDIVTEGMLNSTNQVVGFRALLVAVNEGDVLVEGDQTRRSGKDQSIDRLSVQDLSASALKLLLIATAEAVAKLPGRSKGPLLAKPEMFKSSPDDMT